MEAKRNNDNKKIEIVKGNTKDLKISNVKDSLTFEEHKNNATKMVKLLFLRTFLTLFELLDEGEASHIQPYPNAFMYYCLLYTKNCIHILV